MVNVLVGGESIEPADRVRMLEAYPQVRFTFAETREALAGHAPEAEIIFAKGVGKEILDAAGTLRWIQAGTAGVDALMRAGIRQREVVLTNARGAHGIPMAENVLTMALCFATCMHLMIRTQPQRSKLGRRVLREKQELHGQTMLVIGLGDIGGTLAQKAQALGMRVLGLRRSQRPFQYCETLYTPRQLMEALPQADHVALCLPLTEETTAIIGEPELRAMRSTAHIYNVGRGAAIDGASLRRALSEGWIAGAGLDCVAPSDTPAADDPLWEMENVILSLHTSGHSPYNSQRITDIFLDNLGRYLSGAPLVNVVDKTLGY